VIRTWKAEVVGVGRIGASRPEANSTPPNLVSRAIINHAVVCSGSEIGGGSNHCRRVNTNRIVLVI